MDFTRRDAQPQSAGPSPSSTSKSKRDDNKWGRIITALVGTAVVVLLIAIVALISFGSPKSEDKYVDSAKLQAVFLNTGQVYFGNIKTLNSKYTVLTNIYYLQAANNNGANNTASNNNNNITLVKLGCELHEPFDQMIINSEQITFWENLQDNGQVAKAVSTFQEKNPNGQKCADQSSSSSTTSGNAAQNAGNNSGNANGTTNTNNNTANTTR
jgi:hypothetical protein